MSETNHTGPVYELDGSRHCYNCGKTWHKDYKTQKWEAEPVSCIKAYATEDKAKIADLEDKIKSLNLDLTKEKMLRVNEYANAARLVAWIIDPQRKPAITAFTEGPERQVAYAVEGKIKSLEEAVCNRLAEAAQVLTRLTSNARTPC